MVLRIELDPEEDGSWFAQVPALGVRCHGDYHADAVIKIQALALRDLADRVERWEYPAESLEITFRLPGQTSSED